MAHTEENLHKPDEPSSGKLKYYLIMRRAIQS
jgi:hypothetical protein